MHLLTLFLAGAQVLAVQQQEPPVVPLELKLSGSLDAARAWAAAGPPATPELEPLAPGMADLSCEAPGEAAQPGGDAAAAAQGAGGDAAAPGETAASMEVDRPSVQVGCLLLAHH